MEKMFDFLDSKKDEMAQMLSAWVKYKSIAVYDSEKSEPFGLECAAILKRALSDAEQLGLNRTTNYGNYIGMIELNDQEPAIGVACHLDVVPVGKEKWDYDPWGGEIIDKKVYGRGSCDNKSAGVAAIYALSALKKFCPDKKNARVYFGCCEEFGMHDFKYFFRNYCKKSDMPPMIVPDAGIGISYGCRGILVAEFDTDMAESNGIFITEIDSGGISGIPGIAKAKVFGIKAEDINVSFHESVSIENTEDGIMITVIGKSCHPSAPKTGINAAINLIKALLLLPIAKKQHKTLSIIDEMYANEFERLYACGVTFVMTSLMFNSGKLSITHNSRFDDGKYIAELKEIINKRLTAGGITITYKRESLPYIVDPESKFVKQLIKSQTEFEGKEPYVGITVAATYAKCFDLGISYGHYSSYKAHQKDEFIPVENILKTAKLLAHTMYNAVNDAL